MYASCAAESFARCSALIGRRLQGLVSVWTSGITRLSRCPRRSPAPCRRCPSGAVAQGRARRERQALRTAVVREQSDTVPAEPQALRPGEAGLGAIGARPRPHANRRNARHWRPGRIAWAARRSDARLRADRDRAAHAPTMLPQEKRRRAPRAQRWHARTCTA